MHGRWPARFLWAPCTKATSQAPPPPAWAPNPLSSTSAPTLRQPSLRQHRSPRPAAHPVLLRTIHNFPVTISEDARGGNLRRSPEPGSAAHSALRCTPSSAVAVAMQVPSLSRRSIIGRRARAPPTRCRQMPPVGCILVSCAHSRTPLRCHCGS